LDSSGQKYDAPPRYDFVEAVVAGDNGQPALQAFVNALNGKGQSDLESSLRVFKGRPRDNLVASYGEDFTKALEGSKPDVWMLLTGGGGQHVVRLEAKQPGIPVNFEDVKDVVQKDWREQTMAQLTTNAVRDMGKKYKIREEQAKP
jgi:pyruvate carboxylase